MTDWAPKGPRNYALSSKRKVFPLDEDSQIPKKEVHADFKAMDSDDDSDIIEAMHTVDPYLHPKNQIILRGLIKLNSLIRDVGSLKKVKTAEVQGQTVAKSLSFKEGLEIAREMGPYLAPGTRKQVETIFEGINRVGHLKNNMVKIQGAENSDIKVDYILESIKPFIAYNKFSQVKQIVNIAKIFQATKGMDEEVESQTKSEDGSKENDQISDLVGLLDKFNSKKNEAE